jgi:hypothetical protein
MVILPAISEPEAVERVLRQSYPAWGLFGPKPRF